MDIIDQLFPLQDDEFVAEATELKSMLESRAGSGFEIRAVQNDLRDNIAEAVESGQLGRLGLMRMKDLSELFHKATESPRRFVSGDSGVVMYGLNQDLWTDSEGRRQVLMCFYDSDYTRPDYPKYDILGWFLAQNPLDSEEIESMTSEEILDQLNPVIAQAGAQEPLKPYKLAELFIESS